LVRRALHLGAGLLRGAAGLLAGLACLLARLHRL
jgi:hypothetical protein